MPDKNEQQADVSSGVNFDGRTSTVEVMAHGVDEDPAVGLSTTRKVLAVAVAVTWVVWQLFVAGTRPPNPTLMRGTHLCFAFTSAALLFPTNLRRYPRAGLIVDLVFAAVSVGLLLYVIRNFTVPDYRRLVSPTSVDMVVGITILVMVFYFVYRTSGAALGVTSILFLLYGLYGNFVPGPVGHVGFSVERVISFAVFRLEGILGIAVAASANLIFPILTYGAFLMAFGGGAFFTKFALALIGHVRGGPGKVAVVASALFGTITGTGSANVATTGVFTIPMMIRYGYRRTTAAAIEASASIGGQILPPVMGAAGFVMAELIGITYAEVVFHAWLPAGIFYLSLYSRAGLEAEKIGIAPIPKADLPELRPVVREGWHFLVSIGFLVYLLAMAGFSVPRSAFYSVIALVVMEFGRRIVQRKPLELGRLITGFLIAARGGAVVGAATAAVMIIISMIGISGIGIKLSSLVLGIAGDSLFILLLLTAAASIILGTGLPTVPTYLVLAVLAAPALVQFGVPLIAAHLFILYYGTWGDLTPPVALGPTVAAGIAGTPLVRTMVESMRVGAIGLVLPFAFVYSPELLLIGGFIDIVAAGGATVVGSLLWIAVLNRFWKGTLSWPQTLVAGVLGTLCFANRDVIKYSAALLGAALLLARIRAWKARGRDATDSLLNASPGPTVGQADA